MPIIENTTTVFERVPYRLHWYSKNRLVLLLWFLFSLEFFSSKFSFRFKGRKKHTVVSAQFKIHSIIYYNKKNTLPSTGSRLLLPLPEVLVRILILLPQW